MGEVVEMAAAWLVALRFGDVVGAALATWKIVLIGVLLDEDW
jgi:hypothetical protein